MFNQIVKDIECELIQAGVTKPQLYKAAKISHSTYLRRKEEPQNFKLDELERIAEVFGKKITIKFE